VELVRKRAAILAQRTAREFAADNCPQMAAAIAYYVLMSIFPLLVVAAGVTGLVIHDHDTQVRLTNAILRNFPLDPGSGRDSVTSAIEAVTGARAGAISFFGLAGAGWSASNMFAAIRRALDTAFDVRTERPFVRQKLVDFAMMLALLPFFVFSIALTSALGFTRDTVTSLPVLGPLADVRIAWHAAGVLVSILVSFLGFTLLLRFVPAARPSWRDSWPGALTAAVLFEIAQVGFAIYLNNFSNFDVVFGSLGAVVAFLLWIYLSTHILLFGAELASEYPRVVSGEFDNLPKPAKRPLKERLSESARALVSARRPRADS
jgi:membrane protein